LNSLQQILNHQLGYELKAIDEIFEKQRRQIEQNMNIYDIRSLSAYR